MKPTTLFALAVGAPIMALPITIIHTSHINTNGPNINTNKPNATLPWFRNATHIAPITYIPPPPSSPLYPLNTTTTNTTTTTTTTTNTAITNTTLLHPPQLKAATTSYLSPTCTYRGNTILSTYYLDGLSPNLDVSKLKDRLNRKCGLTRHFLYDTELPAWYASVDLSVPGGKGEGGKGEGEVYWAAEWNHYMATPECVARVVGEVAGLGVGAKCVKVKGGPVADGDDEHGKRRPGRG